MEMGRTDAEFERFIHYGKEWEFKVYRLLRQRFSGLRAPKPAEQVISHTPDPDPDMALNGFPIEAKRRKFDFTNKDDYPYPTFYINEEYKMRDRSIPAHQYYNMGITERRRYTTPFLCYLTANRAMTHMGVIIPATKPYWTLEEKSLKLDDRKSFSWACQLNKVLFMPVAEWESILDWI